MERCYHCSEACEVSIPFDGKPFCCEGCRTVYDILHSNNMEEYYAMNERPGLKTNVAQSKYDFLDLDEVQEKLLLFSEGSISRVKLYLPQIHCSSCLWLLEHLHKINPAIIASVVHFSKKEAEITFNHHELSLKQLAHLLWSIGYPPDISLASVTQPTGRKRKNENLILQIGITGFCFGNIMLMSFPEYLGIDQQFKNFQDTFGYLNLILSIPVLIYGAKDYIISSFRSLQHRTININVPITLGIFALYSRSVYEVVSGEGAGYFDSFAGFIFFLLIGKWFQQKTYSAINFERDYKSYFPVAATKIVEGEEQLLTLKDVKVSDRLLIRNNELIPADAKLLKGEARIDYSFVSGESGLIRKQQGDHLYAGGKQMGAAIEVEVKKPVDNSYLTSLWNSPIFHQEKNTSKLSDRVSKYFTVVVLLIALIGAIYWYLHDPSKTAFIITSILIVACPCAVALSVPFTYGNIIRQLGKKSFYLRSADVVEPLNEMTDIVFDKTGTMTLSEKMEISWQGDELSEEEKDKVRLICSQSTHPLSRGIVNYLGKRSSGIQLNAFQEIAGKGIEAEVQGEHWRMGSGHWIKTTDTATETKVHLEKGGDYKGCFVFQNSYREGVFELMKNLSRNYRIHLLSGDNSSERNKLQTELGDKMALHFNCSPQQKLAYISELQKAGRKVMMLGDGLNDAGALKQADVGVAVVDDVYAFSPSSDAILDGKKLAFLQQYIQLAKYGRKVVWMSYAFSLLYNSVGLYFALTGQLTPLIAAILMPLSSISVVLLVTTLTTLNSHKIR
ncbi:MAG: heavy metal translocating P-type ATPase metal-binding domain-containing protein [Crocinitomicaceae bacterium]